MPLYEYRCSQCHSRVTLLVRGSSPDPVCPLCGGKDLSRLFSTFAVHRTYMDDYQSILGDSRLVKGLESNDPRALAEWNRKMSHGLDEAVEPEYKDMLERMERGEMPAAPLGEDAPAGPSGPEG